MTLAPEPDQALCQIRPVDSCQAAVGFLLADDHLSLPRTCAHRQVLPLGNNEEAGCPEIHLMESRTAVLTGRQHMCAAIPGSTQGSAH